MGDKKTLKKLVCLFQPHRRAIVILVIFLLLSSAANLLMPLMNKHIMDDGFLKNDLSQVAIFSLFAFLLFSLDKGLNLLKEGIRIHISAKIKNTLYETAYSHINRLKISYFHSSNYASLLNNINVDIGNMSRVTDDYVFFVATQLFSIIGGIAGLLMIDWKLTLIVLSFVPVKFLLTHFFAKKRQQFMREYLKKNNDFALWFGDMVGGIKESRLFGIVSCKEREFENKIQNVIEIERKASMLDAWNITSELMIMQLLVTSLYIIGANMVFDLRLTVGGIFAFITYSSYVTNPISAIVNLRYVFSGILPSAQRYYEFLDLETEENEASKEHSLGDYVFKGDIKFSNVSFSYEAGNPILQNVTFNIEAGQKVAVIGKNGSGKSTLINLVLRFYEVENGEITIDGIRIQDLKLEEYRQHISVVDQQFYLFDGSIKDNLQLYADVSDKVLVQAIEDSRLTDFISLSSMEHRIGQNGACLSGGQRQKLALARALVHEREIIIWDEAASHLDAESEWNINELLTTRFKTKTVIMVTHNPEVLKYADQIVAIENGKVIHVRSHETLERILYEGSRSL
ncbi:ABC transporter ATP-binding protein [Paenibacillus thiaminolyticus]|uniref:ABC transporter ATP-binding protein n=1 Tax=Paenibacillus thiaminolyticus TaxID=49283 RepID=UPI0035A72A62